MSSYLGGGLRLVKSKIPLTEFHHGQSHDWPPTVQPSFKQKYGRGSIFEEVFLFSTFFFFVFVLKFRILDYYFLAFPLDFWKKKENVKREITKIETTIILEKFKFWGSREWGEGGYRERGWWWNQLKIFFSKFVM